MAMALNQASDNSVMGTTGGNQVPEDGTGTMSAGGVGESN